MYAWMVGEGRGCVVQGSAPPGAAGYDEVMQVTEALRASIARQGAASSEAFLAVLNVLQPLQQVGPPPLPAAAFPLRDAAAAVLLSLHTTAVKLQSPQQTYHFAWPLSSE